MPELPEVEVVRRGLEAHVLGGVFEDVEVLHPRANRGQDVPLADLLVGARIEAVRRRGKYLWLDLGEDALFVHLGMSGQMLLGPTTSAHVRIRSRISGKELNFVDQRTFGRWLYTPQVAGVPVPVAHIARDPLEVDFDAVAVARLIRRKRSAIKAVLLNQEVVSGIGNIYADEALWQAGIAPTRRASSLLQREAVVLIDAAADVMRRALAEGGTSFDSLYVNVNGESGYFSRSLNAYGREGLPCGRCGTVLRRIVVGGRSSHFCPECQR
ncbi:bifunctional DNA-formamidopyrimidine glycosylase/DNA-(apurinic or apyrimidinic site) lyase [Corynebacterium sp.]|uniref:bifunctional DNA-formamidopyrimidine glycosylase/DNA-(apurinic or apyrimidinic site) lyase n=1 Tax=Corynebacterium sp. TaxID=1720 RepID=UPI0026DF1E73|nr:bifunctional DNA-formamidopyrimidine glycosylase/DNA-(apurinic or apyrimidinic site) lyase [Corynebacterium sp.]MDO5513368.1 bifunctional DNA-formamidopyrimidine glycosylase/DNA-(apurinic or apyrimidinic site) lyase [Corynebacterium sp.]